MAVFKDDPALLRAFRAGDAAALTKVYWHYVDDVAKAVRSGLVLAEGRVPALAPADQADGIQEVFCRAFAPHARQAFDGLRPYRPYLLRIAHNFLIDRLRAKRADEPSGTFDDMDALAELQGDDGFEPGPAPAEDALDCARTRERVAAYVPSCDRELATFIDLRFVHELGQAEVAERMGVTRRRVRTLEQRALRGLRTFLRRAGHVQMCFSKVEPAGTGRATPLPRP